MRKIVTPFTAAVTGLSATALVLASLLGSVNHPAAVAEPVAASSSSVCKTGHRGQEAYDRACLHTGDVNKVAADLWFSTPEGKAGHEGNDFMTRRAICKPGNVRARAVDLVADLTYDTYRNNGRINSRVADIAQGDCLRLGYSDPKSGLTSADLRTLPDRKRCWVESYYLGREIVNEPICKY